MRFSLYRTTVAILIFVCLIPSHDLHAASGPKIHSIASFYDGGTEQYRAALYVSASTELLTSEAAHAVANGMAFKIKRTRWSARSWLRDLNQRVAINNDALQLRVLSDSLVELSQLFEKPFYKGDLIEIERLTDVLVVRVNGLLIGELSGTALFPLLLNAWLGDIPPSTEFKQSLLGVPVDYSDAQTFLTLDEIDQRQARVQTWLSEVSPDTPKNGSLGVDGLGIEENRGREAIVAEIESPALASPDQAVEVLSLVQQEPVLTESVTDKDLKPESDVVVDVSLPAAIDAQEQQLVVAEPIQLSSMVSSHGEVVIQTEESVVPHENDLAADALVSKKVPAQSEALSQYREVLTRHSTPYIKYPLRSQAKREQGVVGIKVTIDRVGQVLDVSIKNSSTYPRLDRAAVAAVKRASPFPVLPESISGDQLEFVLPLAFRLL